MSLGTTFLTPSLRLTKELLAMMQGCAVHAISLKISLRLLASMLFSSVLRFTSTLGPTRSIRMCNRRGLRFGRKYLTDSALPSVPIAE